MPDSQPTEEVSTEEAVTLLVDGLIATGKVEFDDSDVTQITDTDLHNLSYAAICQGYGFTPDFEVPYHNHLSDDLDNEAYGFLELLDTAALQKDVYGRWHFTRPGLERALHYWYQMGYGLRNVWDFPYSDGVNAEQFMAMTEAERAALMEPE